MLTSNKSFSIEYLIENKPVPSRFIYFHTYNEQKSSVAVDSKRMRTAFTSGQLFELEREFTSNMYLSRLR